MLLENTVLKMPGYALKAYFCSWVKAEREDCLLVFWMFLCRLSCKCRKNRRVTNLKCLLASHCFSNWKSWKWITSHFCTVATGNFLTQLNGPFVLLFPSRCDREMKKPQEQQCGHLRFLLRIWADFSGTWLQKQIISCHILSQAAICFILPWFCRHLNLPLAFVLHYLWE